MSDIESEHTMAHIMYKAGMFSSVSEARRNGWNIPVKKGKFLLKKKRREVHIL